MYPTLVDLGVLKLHSYGVLVFVGQVLAWVMAFWLLRRQWSPEVRAKATTTQVLTYALAVSLFGGLAGIVAFVNWRSDRSDEHLKWLWMVPLALVTAKLLSLASGAIFFGEVSALIRPWESKGIGFVGSLAGTLGALLAWVALSRLGYFRFWPSLDVVAPSLVLAWSVAKVGCFLEGCCWGAPTSSLLGVSFPPGAPLSAAMVAAGTLGANASSPAVHPLQLYLALGYAAAAALGAWRHYRGPRFSGQAALLSLIALLIVRLLTDPLRGALPGPAAGHPPSTVYAIALFLALAGALYAILWSRRSARVA